MSFIVPNYNSHSYAIIFGKSGTIKIDFVTVVLRRRPRSWLVASWFCGCQGLEWDSICRSRECSSTLSRGRDGFPSQRLFRRFHKFHKTNVKSSGSAVPAKIKPVKSVKHVFCLRMFWFHSGVLFHRACKAGQR